MTWWPIIKLIWTVLAFIILGVTLLAVYRARGVWVWKRSLQSELSALREKGKQATGPASQSMLLIERQCQGILKSSSPELAELTHLHEYIRSIAGCYYPESDHPELQVTIGPLLNSIEKSLARFDRILHRPVFKRLRGISIRKIKTAKNKYTGLTRSRFFQFYLKHKNKIERISILRVLVFFDPLTGLAYLSNKLTTLLLVKYLLVDLYLFFGNMTLNAFNAEKASDPGEESAADQENLEKILEELNSIKEDVKSNADPEIMEIRAKLVGFGSILFSNPGFSDWKNAVMEAAGVIAGRHFPMSNHALEEAAIGPLLERSRVWIGNMSKGEEYLLARRFYQLRINTLVRAKNLTDLILPELVKKIIKKTYQTYGVLKWPLQVYRWVKKRSPWSIALEVGWQAAKKASLAHLYGKAFDKACQELEIVYASSSRLNAR